MWRSVLRISAIIASLMAPARFWQINFILTGVYYEMTSIYSDGMPSINKLRNERFGRRREDDLRMPTTAIWEGCLRCELCVLWPNCSAQLRPRLKWHIPFTTTWGEMRGSAAIYLLIAVVFISIWEELLHSNGDEVWLNTVCNFVINWINDPSYHRPSGVLVAISGDDRLKSVLTCEGVIKFSKALSDDQLRAKKRKWSTKAFESVLYDQLIVISTKRFCCKYIISRWRRSWIRKRKEMREKEIQGMQEKTPLAIELLLHKFCLLMFDNGYFIIRILTRSVSQSSTREE